MNVTLYHVLIQIFLLELKNDSLTKCTTISLMASDLLEQSSFRFDKQEGNGPLDSRAKVMISNKKFGLIWFRCFSGPL